MRAVLMSVSVSACVSVLMSVSVSACASASAPASAPASASASASASSAEAPPIPTKCSSPDAPLCLPDPTFVSRLCNGSFPDVALILMRGTTPFARMYMKGDVDGWNADGGASARAKLHFDEEMLVLRRRTGSSIVVGAGGGYLAMRWDGNCYTLDENQLSAKKPPSPKTAGIPWRSLTETTKNALLQSPQILAAYQKRGKECKGAISGTVTKACEQADSALSAAIVAEIRGGLTVPTPDHLP